MPRITVSAIPGTKLSKKLKKFADAKLEGKSGIQAALESYDTTDPHTAGQIAHENLKKPDVIEYLQQMAYGAATRIVQISEKSTNDAVKLRANEQILDRALGKPVEFKAIKMEGELFINLD